MKGVIVLFTFTLLLSTAGAQRYEPLRAQLEALSLAWEAGSKEKIEHWWASFHDTGNGAN